MTPPLRSTAIAPATGRSPRTAGAWSVSPGANPTKARRRSRPISGGCSGCGPRRPLQLVPEVLDLVPELGRVLEAEVLGGGEHLLLELDDQLLELLGRAHL